MLLGCIKIFGNSIENPIVVIMGFDCLENYIVVYVLCYFSSHICSHYNYEKFHENNKKKNSKNHKNFEWLKLHNSLKLEKRIKQFKP